MSQTVKWIVLIAIILVGAITLRSRFPNDKMELGEPLINSSSEVFARMYYDNPVVADPYLGKIVSITGVVDRIVILDKVTIVHMKTTTVPMMFGFKVRKGLAVTKRGEQATIKGIVQGMTDGFVVFSNCKLIR